MSTSSRPALDEVAVSLMGQCHANVKHTEEEKSTRPDLMNESGRPQETLKLKTSGAAPAWSTTCCLYRGRRDEKRKRREERVGAMGQRERERLEIRSRE